MPWCPWHPQMTPTPHTPLGVPQCPLISPIPFLAHSYLESLPAPNTTLTPLHPDALKMAMTPCSSPQCPLMPYTLFGPWVFRALSAPIHPWHPYTPDTPKHPLHPYTSRISIPPDAPYTLLAPEYLESLPVPQYTPDTPTPLTPHNGPHTPTPLFSIVIIFNFCHFATDHLQEYVQFTIYHL